jgi:mono/diheme cytochrome c family protein
MRKSAFLAFGLVLFTAVAGLGLWLDHGPDADRAMGATCLTLATAIERIPAAPVTPVDYGAFAKLKVPPLSPEAALDTFAPEPGFRIEVVAHEPMISDPVAMDIDPDGRLWVVDMPSYMPVHDLSDWDTAVREQVPKCRVVVLEDTDGDGRMDVRRIFREGLILPRAIKVLRDGVLVGEPPNVWLIHPPRDGAAGVRERVSSSYGDPNLLNVEGMPNGLMWGMDNWLHSAREAGESLRLVGGRWRTRPFEPLGQWGITQDNWGRLYSSNNSWPLEMNLVPHGYSGRHPLFAVRTGISARIAPNAPLWPAHPTGVNRGYRRGQEVREDGTLRQNTSASSTVIYRGDQFGDRYVGNAFTPEPAGNMIQRILIDSEPGEIEARARFAYDDHEFLTSTDERFRPVNIYNAPDGSLYVVDMYRGLIQHARYLTEYLRTYAVERDLHLPAAGFGRIYRIVRTDRPIDYRTPRFSALTAREVVGYLRHANGHLRDRAQQVLAQCSPIEVVRPLEALVGDSSAPAYTRLQALWTLDGFDREVYGQDRVTQIALRALDDEHPRVRGAAIRLLEPAIARGSHEVIERLRDLAAHEPAPSARLQLVASLGEGRTRTSLELIARLLEQESSSHYVREMALTGVHRREAELAEILRDRYGWPAPGNEPQQALLTSLDDATAQPREENLERLTAQQREQFERGRQRYAPCTGCHGVDGRGASGIGPPLAGSAWAQAAPRAVVRLLLQGFSGGAAERGENVAGVMPGHAFLSDDDIAAILTYIRQSWGNDSAPIAADDVRRVREETADRRDIWSPEELRRLLH